MRSLARSQQSEPAPLTRMAANTLGLLEKKLWLPRPVYDCLPWFYLLSGLLSLAATVYINSRPWEQPHFVLFAAGCLHLSGIIFRRRNTQEPEYD